MKPLWIGLFIILSANDHCKNYSLDLYSDQSPNLIYNTFHVSNIKPHINNNPTLLPQDQFAKPGPVLQDKYEVKKIIEYRTAPKTDKLQYKVCWAGYSLEDDQ